MDTCINTLSCCALPLQVRALISDKQLAKRVAQAARQEVEALTWRASVAKVRKQYGTAWSWLTPGAAAAPGAGAQRQWLRCR